MDHPTSLARPAALPRMSHPVPLPPDTFGDRFTLADLPLPRPAAGFGVQHLDTDQLLDRRSGRLLPVRTPALDPLFDSFDAAHAAAAGWLERTGTPPEAHPLAIVPVGYDPLLQRHVLIYGVLRAHP